MNVTILKLILYVTIIYVNLNSPCYYVVRCQLYFDTGTVWHSFRYANLNARYRTMLLCCIMLDVFWYFDTDTISYMWILTDRVIMFFFTTCSKLWTDIFDVLNSRKIVFWKCWHFALVFARHQGSQDEDSMSLTMNKTEFMCSSRETFSGRGVNLFEG